MTGPDGTAPTAIVKHSISIAGHRTSVSLEAIFWDRLRAIAAARKMSLAALVAHVDAGRGPANLSSALRVFVLAASLPSITQSFALQHETPAGAGHLT